MRIALLTLVACETVPAPVPPPTVAPIVESTIPSPPTVAPIVESTRFVLADVLERYDECSNAGGEHYVLKLLDGTNRLAHAGGHGWHQNLVPYDAVELQFGPPRQPVLAVVELDDSAIHDTYNPSWCLVVTSRLDVRAEHARRVASREEGQRLISRMVREDRWLRE